VSISVHEPGPFRDVVAELIELLKLVGEQAGTTTLFHADIDTITTIPAAQAHFDGAFAMISTRLETDALNCLRAPLLFRASGHGSSSVRVVFDDLPLPKVQSILFALRQEASCNSWLRAIFIGMAA